MRTQLSASSPFPSGNEQEGWIWGILLQDVTPAPEALGCVGLRPPEGPPLPTLLKAPILQRKASFPLGSITWEVRGFSLTPMAQAEER